MIIQRGKHHILNSGHSFFIEGKLAMLPEVESIDEPSSLDMLPLNNNDKQNETFIKVGNIDLV